MDIEQFRKAGYQAIDRICDYYYSLQNKPVVSAVEPGYLRKSIPDAPPEDGEDFQVIADDYQKLIVPGLTHWQHPSFFAYYPTACTFEGMIADLYATSTCNPGFNWLASPACTELEAITMDWAARLLGLGPAFMNSSKVGGGAIQTTASESALIAVVAARSLYQQRYPDVKMEDLVIYTTTQTHSLGLKAGLVLSLQVRALEVTAEDRFSLRGETLRAALDEDQKAGRKPFILIATVGTTSSGAVDNLPEIKDVVKDHPSLWVHIDAAWAGVALCCPEYREMCYLEEINEFADSFCTNFHKWGLVNFDASTLWVRDRKYLTDALDVTPPFLRTKQGDAGESILSLFSRRGVSNVYIGTVIDYRNWHLSLGRRFRSLKLWFVLRSFGVKGFQAYIRRTVGLSNHFADFVKTSEILSLVTPPSLALTVFRVDPRPTNGAAPYTLESLNELNKLFHERVTSRQDIMLTQTSLNGVFCIRLAVGAARTEPQHIEAACALIETEAKAAIGTWRERALDQLAN